MFSKGDLTQIVTRDYQGAFNEVKQSVNGTVTNLKELVGQIKDATTRSIPPPRKSPLVMPTCRNAPKNRHPAWRKPPPAWKN